MAYSMKRGKSTKKEKNVPTWDDAKYTILKKLISEGLSIEGNELPKWFDDINVLSLTVASEMLRDALLEDGTLLWESWYYVSRGDEPGWYYLALWRLVDHDSGKEYYVVVYEEPYYLYARAFPDQETAKKELNTFFDRIAK